MSEPAGAGREFRKEIRGALRYEKGLVLKAIIALVVVAVVVVLRTMYAAG